MIPDCRASKTVQAWMFRSPIDAEVRERHHH